MCVVINIIQTLYKGESGKRLKTNVCFFCSSSISLTTTRSLVLYNRPAVTDLKGRAVDNVEYKRIIIIIGYTTMVVKYECPSRNGTDNIDHLTRDVYSSGSTLIYNIYLYIII